MRACKLEKMDYQEVLLKYPYFCKFSDYFFDDYSAFIYTSEDNTRVLVVMIFEIKGIARGIRFIMEKGEMVFFRTFKYIEYPEHAKEYYSIGNMFFHVREMRYLRYDVLMVGIVRKYRIVRINIDSLLVCIEMMWLKARLAKLII